MAETGRQIVNGRYRLTKVLGRGGMGRVWRAHDETLGRDVALKQLAPPDVVDAQAHSDLRTRFRNEARIAGRLHHPGIVTIYDIVENGDLWIVMQLVEGRSLHDAIDSDGPLPHDDVARIGLALLDALQAAHAEGVIHRDVTPRNVLLASNGDVVLGDFGIAAAVDITSVTKDGAVVGTPGYMAPERLKGHQATGRSDLWSLGATLYHAVEADRPFRVTEPGALVAAILGGSVTPPTKAGWLTPLLLDLLAIDPHQRPDPDAVRCQLTDRLASTGATAIHPTQDMTVPRYGPPTTVDSQQDTGSGDPGGDTLVMDSPPTPAPRPKVFRPSRAGAFKGLAVSLLALSLGLGSGDALIDGRPAGGCNEDRSPATTQSTAWCDHGKLTALTAGVTVVAVFAWVGGGIGLVASLVQLAKAKPTLTIDERGIDFRIGSKASRRRAGPQLPWHAIQEASVVDARGKTTLTGSKPRKPVETKAKVVVALYAHAGTQRLPRVTYNTELGAHVLCDVQEVGGARRLAKIKAAIDAHTHYRRTIGLYSVTLDASGADQINLASALQSVADIDWKRAKKLASRTPTRVLERVTAREAEAAKATLERAGGAITIEPM